MEVIVSILIVVFLFATANDKKKKKGVAARRPGAETRMNATRAAASRTVRAAAPEEAKEVEADPKATFEDALAEMRRKLEGQRAAARRPATVVAAPAPRQGEPMLADDDCLGGSMEHTHAEGHSGLEDEECVGGSMEHTHTEGVSRSAHARRMAAIDAAPADEDVLPETFDARALRRAVVMAEVLGRPKALRARRSI